jgi:hemerythrin superfamily protein
MASARGGRGPVCIQEAYMNKQDIPVGQQEVLGQLLDDHRKVKQFFKDFARAKNVEDKQTLAHEACLLLTVHTRLEEELLYPFLRARNAPAFGHLLNEAVVEHACAKMLISQIQGMSPDDSLFDAKVTVLGEYIAHHLEEEEGELFPKLVVLKVDLRGLADELRRRREELSRQLLQHDEVPAAVAHAA